MRRLALVFLYVLVAIGLIALVLLLVQTHRQDRAMQRRLSEAATQEDQTRQAMREDLALLGNDVDRNAPLDDLGTMVDDNWTAVTRAYRQVQDSLTHARTSTQLTQVTEQLAVARQLLTNYRAELLAEPVPTPQAPCFFNPNHGPSDTIVTWYASDGVDVKVPCCSADARRLASGAAPYARTFRTESGRQPWWQVGAPAGDWARGWFAGWRDTPVWTQLIIAAPALSDSAAPVTSKPTKVA